MVQQAPLTLLVTVINAVLTSGVIAPVGNRGLLLVWVALIVAVSGARMVVRQRFLHRAPNNASPRPWAIFSILGSLTTGLLWGVGAMVMSPAVEIYQLFFVFVLGGMCAGTTAVNSAHLPTVLAFILPAILPLAVSFLFEGSVPRLVWAVMLLVFASALSLTSWRGHRAFGERIRLHLALCRQDRELLEANERLRNEVAERQKAEARLHQAQKMEAIGHLTGGVAHDFNNLLQVVVGNLHMIGRLADDNIRIHRHIRAAEQAVKQGAQLTGSLLAFARRQTLRVERVDLNTTLQEFQPILLQAIGDTVQLRNYLAPDLPRCEVDPVHFKSAILNLVINARDAMPGGGQLSITTGETILNEVDLAENPDARPGRFVSVSVRDSGSGMATQILAQVFEPFFTTKEIGKGSGLGLSQVYGFVRQSGGHVHLSSNPGAGTVVSLYFPGLQ